MPCTKMAEKVSEYSKLDPDLRLSPRDGYLPLKERNGSYNGHRGSTEIVLTSKQDVHRSVPKCSPPSKSTESKFAGAHKPRHQVSSKTTKKLVNHRNLDEHSTKVLLRSLDPNNVFLSVLESEEIMTTSVCESIKAIPRLQQQSRNLKLFKWLKKDVSTDGFKRFIEILKRNDQEHVANYLTGEKHGELPMSEHRHRRLLKIKPTLMTCISYTELFVSVLLQKRAISESDHQIIKSDPVNYDRICAVIDAVLRRSNSAFDSLVLALTETEQTDLAHYMGGGIVFPVQVKTTSASTDDQLAVDLKVNSTDGASNGGASCKGSDGIHPSDLKIVGSVPGQDGPVYLYCRSASETKLFLKMFKNEQILGVIDNKLRRNSPDRKLRIESVTLNKEEEQLCSRFIKKSTIEIPSNGNLAEFTSAQMLIFLREMRVPEATIEEWAKLKITGKQFANMSSEDLSRFQLTSAVVRHFHQLSSA